MIIISLVNEKNMKKKKKFQFYNLFKKMKMKTILKREQE